MTEKSPDFSQKVWLLVERNGGYKWLLFFLSGLRPCQDLPHCGWFGGGTERGRLSPWGRGSMGNVCSFGGGTEGGKIFLLVWLSCPFLSYFSRTTLISLSLIVSVFPVFMSIRSYTLISVFCATLGTAHTSQRGQAPYDMRTKRSLSVLSLSVPVADCHHTVKQIRHCLSVCCSTVVALSPRSTGKSSKLWGGKMCQSFLP